MTKWTVGGLGVLGALATAASFLVPDAPAFPTPSLARIVLFHLPSALMTAGLVALAAWFGFAQLLKPAASPRLAAERDVRLAATQELGALFGVFTMTTGILFSRVQWGAWWQWDPRQTSFLFVLLILAGGLALRTGLADEAKRASASAAYAAASALPALFLIFVFPRLGIIQQQSFHPSTTVSQNAFDGTYRTGLLLVLASLIWTAVVVYRLRVRAGHQELALIYSHGPHETRRDGSAPHRVGRPVPVPEER